MRRRGHISGGGLRAARSRASAQSPIALLALAAAPFGATLRFPSLGRTLTANSTRLATGLLGGATRTMATEAVHYDLLVRRAIHKRQTTSRTLASLTAPAPRR